MVSVFVRFGMLIAKAKHRKCGRIAVGVRRQGMLFFHHFRWTSFQGSGSVGVHAE